MPALPQSNIHLDILMGRDESLEPADFFSGAFLSSLCLLVRSYIISNSDRERSVHGHTCRYGEETAYLVNLVVKICCAIHPYLSFRFILNQASTHDAILGLFAIVVLTRQLFVPPRDWRLMSKFIGMYWVCLFVFLSTASLSFVLQFSLLCSLKKSRNLIT